MSLTFDTVKNFAEWDQPQWRAFFQTDGFALTQANMRPADVEKCVHTREFQDAMVKVGILGGNAIYEQTPSVWNVELNNKIPPFAGYGEPSHFKKVTLLATRVILQSNDFDEALLIKQEGSEPLMLFRMSKTWYFKENSTVDESGSVRYSPQTSVVGEWQAFEKAAKICADESARKSQTGQYLMQHQRFSSPLANLVTSYFDLGVDKHAQDKRALRQALYVEFNERPPCEDWVTKAHNASKTASAIIAQYLDEPENYRKEPEPAVQRVEAEPLPPLEDTKEPQSWCTYLSLKACSFFNWIMSLFN